MKLKVFTKNIIIVAIILAVVFMSQRSDFRQFGEKLYSQAAEQINNYTPKLSSWFMANVYPKVGGGAERGKEVIEKEFIGQKDNAAKNIWEKFKNYLAEKFSKMSGTKVE